MKRISFENLNFSPKDILARAEMKKVLGGDYNPNCGTGSNYDDWYCCTGEVEHLGWEECNAASDRCASDGGSGITNDPTRCYY